MTEETITPATTAAETTANRAIAQPRFAVGQRARHHALGVDREVLGVRTGPEGEQLLFAADGNWLSAEGFELLEETAAPEPVPQSAEPNPT